APITRPGKFRAESMGLDSAGNVYFSSGSEIFMLDPPSAEARLLISSQTTYFDRILVDDDRIWIGDAFGAIAYFDLHTRDSIFEVNSGPSTITHIFKDADKNIWFSGRSQELVKVSEAMEVSLYKEVKNSLVVRASQLNSIFCGASGKDSLLYVFDAKEDR